MKIYLNTLKVFLSLILVLSPIFVSAQAKTLPFGGRVAFVTKCTCSPGFHITFAFPFYLPAPTMIGALYYDILRSPPVVGGLAPGAPATYSFFNPYAPLGIFDLGDYTPGGQECQMNAGPSGCVTLPTLGTISRVGSSLTPSI